MVAVSEGAADSAPALGLGPRLGPAPLRGRPPPSARARRRYAPPSRAASSPGSGGAVASSAASGGASDGAAGRGFRRFVARDLRRDQHRFRLLAGALVAGEFGGDREGLRSALGAGLGTDLSIGVGGFRVRGRFGLRRRCIPLGSRLRGVLLLGGLFRARLGCLHRQQALPVGDGDLVVVGMDLRQRQEAVAVAAVLHEGGLERRLHPHDLGQVDVALEGQPVRGFEVEILQPVAVQHHHAGFFRVGGVDQHALCHRRVGSAPLRAGKAAAGGGSGWGGPDDGGRTARTLHMRRPSSSIRRGARARGGRRADRVVAAAHGHPGPRPRVGALVPRLARATRTVRRIGASPAEAGTTELAGRVSVAGGRLDPPSASAAWRDLSRGDGRGRPGLLTLGESPAKRGNRGRPRGRVGSMPGSPGCDGRPPSSLAVAALP